MIPKSKIFLVTLLCFFSLSGALTPDDALKNAESELEAKLKDEMVAGAQSRRAKKVTEGSASMSVRNAVFRRSVEMLEQHGAEAEEARAMAKQAVSRKFGKLRPGEREDIRIFSGMNNKHCPFQLGLRDIQQGIWLLRIPATPAQV